MITILSPHNDDAIFSLGLAMDYWNNAGIPLRVINFFTVSEYAPLHTSQTRDEVTAARTAEDIAAISAVSDAIERIDLGLLDAPLRLGVLWERITHPDWFHDIDMQEASGISKQLESLASRGAVIAPLALGDHVDHHVISRAALEAFPPAQSPVSLAFYEDLPYATFLSDKQIRQHVSRLGLQRPVYVRIPYAVHRKKQLALLYRSQINDSEAERISNAALRYSEGERIWIASRNSPENLGHRPLGVGPSFDWDKITCAA